MARYCTNCYTPAQGGESFCRNCGQPLSAEPSVQAAQSAQNEETVEIQPPVVMEKPEPKEEVKAEPIRTEPVNPPHQPPMAEIVSFGEWVWSTLLCFIPLVNLIMLIIWAATAETNPNKQNFAKAMLIWTIVGIVLSFIFFTMMMALVMVGSASYGYGFTL